MNKRGQTVGIQTVTALAIGIFILVLVAIGIFAGAASIKDSSIFTTGSLEKNNSDMLLNNLTEATTEFGANFSTFFSILAVVLIVGFIGLLIFVVTRFRGSRSVG